MASAGTAYVRIQPDFSRFNAEVSGQIKALEAKGLNLRVNEQGMAAATNSTSKYMQAANGAALATGKATKAAEVHSSAMAKVSQGLTGAGNAMQATGRRAQSLGADIQKIGTPIAAVAAGAVFLQMKFQGAMEQVHTQAGYSQAAVERLSKSVLAVAPDLARTPEELAQGLYHIASVGIPAAKAMDVLRAAAEGANISGASFDDTANAVVTTLKNFPNTVGGAKAVMAELNAIVGAGNMHMQDLVVQLGKVVPAAKAFGLTLNDVGAGLDVMTAHGMTAGQAATALKMAISTMGAPSAIAAQELKKIGLTSTQLADDMRKPNGMSRAVTDLADHLKHAGLTATQQAQVLSRAFGGGRTGAGVMLLTQNVGDLNRILGKLPQGTAAVKALDAAQASWEKTSEGQFAHLKATLATVGVQIGASLSPIVVPLFKNISSIVKTVAHDFQGLPKPVKEFTLALGALAIVAGPLLKVISGIASVGGGAFKLLGGLTGKGGAGALSSVLSSAKPVPVFVTNAGFGGVGGVGSGAAGAVAKTGAVGAIAGLGTLAIGAAAAVAAAIVLKDQFNKPLNLPRGSTPQQVTAAMDLRGIPKNAQIEILLKLKQEGAFSPRNLAVGAVDKFYGTWNAEIQKHKMWDFGSLSKSINSQLSKLPQMMRPMMAAAMVANARELERQGRLPAGAAARVAQDIMRRYHILIPGLAATAKSSQAEIVKAFQRHDVVNAAEQQRKNLEKTYANFPKLAKTTGRNMATNWLKEMDFLESQTHSKNKNTADQANKDLARVAKDAKRNSHSAAVDFIANLEVLRAGAKGKSHKTATEVVAEFEWLRHEGGGKWGKLKQSAVQAVIDMAIGVRPTTDSTAQALYDAFSHMKLNADELAKALGITPAKLSLSAVQHVAAGAKAATNNPLPKLFAGGGLMQIGRPGDRGRDTVPLSVGGTDIVVGKGEQVAVFNHDQQALMNRRLADYGGLDGMFKRVNRPHYMAQGGLVPRRMAGGGTLSYAQLEGLWDQAGGNPSAAAMAAAIAEAESGGNTGAVGSNSNGTVDRGAWQINSIWGGLSTTDPLANARAAIQISKNGTNWGPWVTYNTGAYRQFLKGGVGPIGGGVGLAAKPVDRQMIAGPDSVLKRADQKISDQGKAAWDWWLAKNTPKVTTAGGGGPGTLPPGASQAMIAVAMAAAFAHIQGRPYVFGGGHGAWESAGYDCSGLVSYILHAAGLLNSPMDTVALAGYGDAGPGQFVTIADLPNPGATGHTMMSAFGKFYESGGGGGGPHTDSGWSQSFPVFRHPRGLARGGLVGDFGGESPESLLKRQPLLAGDPRFVAYKAAWKPRKRFGLGGVLDSLKRRFASGGNVWRVKYSLEDSASGSGWTELSTNGNGAAASGHQRTASSTGGWDFATLGRMYPKGTQLRITGSRTATLPLTDYGNGSSFAPAIGLTPAAQAATGASSSGSTVDIQLPNGNINLASGFGHLVSGSGGGGGGGGGKTPAKAKAKPRLHAVKKFKPPKLPKMPRVPTPKGLPSGLTDEFNLLVGLDKETGELGDWQSYIDALHGVTGDTNALVTLDDGSEVVNWDGMKDPQNPSQTLKGIHARLKELGTEKDRAHKPYGSGQDDTEIGINESILDDYRAQMAIAADVNKKLGAWQTGVNKMVGAEGGELAFLGDALNDQFQEGNMPSPAWPQGTKGNEPWPNGNPWGKGGGGVWGGTRWGHYQHTGVWSQHLKGLAGVQPTTTFNQWVKDFVSKYKDRVSEIAVWKKLKARLATDKKNRTTSIGKRYDKLLAKLKNKKGTVNADDVMQQVNMALGDELAAAVNSISYKKPKEWVGSTAGWNKEFLRERADLNWEFTGRHHALGVEAKKHKFHGHTSASNARSVLGHLKDAEGNQLSTVFSDRAIDLQNLIAGDQNNSTVQKKYLQGLQKSINNEHTTDTTNLTNAADTFSSLGDYTDPLGTLALAKLTMQNITIPGQVKESVDLGATVVPKSSSTTGAASTDDFRLLLDQLAGQRKGIEAFQSSVLRGQNYYAPYGGSFATGGVVPGPPGEPRTIIAHGGEYVQPQGAGTPVVMVNIDGKGVALADLIDTRIEHSTRRMSRTPALPGRAGRFG